MATKSKAAATAPALPQGSARTEANRKRKLQKLLKSQPNNKQIQNALLESGTKRKAPINHQWSHSAIRLAKLFKEFCGHAPKELFSSNPKVQQAALATVSKQRTGKLPQGKVDFSIGARAFIRQGSQWN